MRFCKRNALFGTEKPVKIIGVISECEDIKGGPVGKFLKCQKCSADYFWTDEHSCPVDKPREWWAHIYTDTEIPSDALRAVLHPIETKVSEGFIKVREVLTPDPNLCPECNGQYQTDECECDLRDAELNQSLIDSYEYNREALLDKLRSEKARAEKLVEAAKGVLAQFKYHGTSLDQLRIEIEEWESNK